MKYVVFSHKGRELCSYTLKEEFAGERENTLELLAEENNISKDDIEVSIKDIVRHKTSEHHWGLLLHFYQLNRLKIRGRERMDA